MPKGLMAATLAVLMLVATPGRAEASDADILRESQDRAAITQLMWTYVRAIDTLNPEAYAAVFTPDGTFNAVKGSDALRKMVVDLKKSQDDRRAKGESIPAMHHVMSNDHIEFIDKDHVRYHYYWMTVFAGQPNGPTPRVAAAGRGVDEVVRVGDKWLIRSRNVAPQD
jgi:hypothetical protein